MTTKKEKVKIALQRNEAMQAKIENLLQEMNNVLAKNKKKKK